MNELVMNFATGRVNYRYLKLLIVAKAVSVKVSCENATMRNHVGVRLEFDSDPVSERNTLTITSKKNLCIAVNLD
jgi:hypothetical protein